ncbi:threonine aldolase family protein [Miniphocaeibacter halophilus]|uniref:Aminotransferase class V-fold PLP-dependent enzyme n=1 Tax=Miniphocaeibacter halophilus TaxID=2931922 RepID=A0AC61NBW4_9FIRM|nr:aminotransferase class V-fold PLP-dependent enzyme [Miniphocaeibacter halophilus]QQK08603.1 aminotransferase class V-fold PLP-dependent enzyme [Miniphocaeibacter halophilus]
MIYLNCDYSDGVHPNILEKLIKTNDYQTGVYGFDSFSEIAKKQIKDLCNNQDLDIYFISGGTQTNVIAISAALMHYQAVISADTGHINTHECGAVENSGHKILTLPNHDGKLIPSDIKAMIKAHHIQGMSKIHDVQPKMVYISNSTEFGTIYSKKEIEELYNVCKELNLFLYIDGARLGYALSAENNDLDLEFIASHCDMFYIGGTKLGAMYGEALVVINPELRVDFQYNLKLRGALLAKGRFLGIQFSELFKDDLYFKLAKHANYLSTKLRKALVERGYKLTINSPTNLTFVVMSQDKLDELSKEFAFETMSQYDENQKVIRIATGWNTKEEYIDKLIEKL